MKVVKKIITIMLLMCMMANILACGRGAKKVLAPLYTKVDMNNLPDGIYHVTFDAEDVSESKGDFYLNIEVYSEDLYDAMEVQHVNKGDTIVYGGIKEKIENVVWDEIEENVAFNVDNFADSLWCLCPSGVGGTYYFYGMDGHHSYTKRGESKVKISKKCIVYDTSKILMGGKEINLDYDYVVNYINNNDDCNFLNTNVRIENGEIVEINKWYIP